MATPLKSFASVTASRALYLRVAVALAASVTALTRRRLSRPYWVLWLRPLVSIASSPLAS
ncbi:hypothetical protein D3C85_1134530 [compost metagenome]